MRKKTLKRAAALAMAAVVSLGGALTAVPAVAKVPDSNVALPMVEGVSPLTTSFDINSSGVADCYASASVEYGYFVELNVYLQQYKSGKWTTYESWSDSGSVRPYVDETKSVPDGYSYRMKTVVKVYKNDKLVTSSTKYSQTEEY